MAELAFEKFGVPAFFLSKNAVLAAFAAGRGTALVLDVGGGTTCAAAVHDGYVLGSSLQKTPLAGDKINELMLKALELRDPPPAIQPLYSLKRSSVGPGEFKTEVVDSPGTHPSYRRYMQLQVRSAARPAHVSPSEANVRLRDEAARRRQQLEVGGQLGGAAELFVQLELERLLIRLLHTAVDLLAHLAHLLGHRLQLRALGAVGG